MAVTSDRAVSEVELPEPFDEGWNLIVGITVEGHRLKIVPDLYFFRYENPTWIVCDWARVSAELLPARETPQWTIEQQACDYVREHGCVTSDPAEVLRVAWEVNAWMFRDELLSEPGLVALGVQPRHTRMLREVTTLMALNRVELTGEISNVGPAWMFPIACQVVYGLDDAETELLDELYHGAWFDERRRIEAVKSNAALGGRLVHGCQSRANMAGGAVVPFGADLDVFRRDLELFRDDWIQLIRSGGS